MLEKLKNVITRNRGVPTFYNEDSLATNEIRLKQLYSFSPQVCEDRIEWDPIANALTIRVANLLTKNPPIFLDEMENELEKIKKDWVKNDYDGVFREAVIASRTHGFSATEKLKKPFAGKNFLVHSPIDMITVNYDDRWNIASYTILPKMEEGVKMNSYAIPDQRDVLYKNCVHYQIGRQKYNQQGVSILKPIWAQMVRANEILEAMAIYDARVAHGIKAVMVDPQLYKDDVGKLKNELKNYNWKKWLILKSGNGSDYAKTEFQIVGAQGAAPDFAKDLETLVGYIAASSGFPSRWFFGDPKGALSAAEEDKKAVYSTLKSIFAEFKDWIRLFIEKFYKNGEVISERIAEINWDDEGILESIEAYLNNAGIGELDAKQLKYVANESQKEVVRDGT